MLSISYLIDKFTMLCPHHECKPFKHVLTRKCIQYMYLDYFSRPTWCKTWYKYRKGLCNTWPILLVFVSVKYDRNQNLRILHMYRTYRSIYVSVIMLGVGFYLYGLANKLCVASLQPNTSRAL